ncbi:CDP-glycerol glycerophosphotransferase [Streptosporangium becharense]|uniref:CDP-glycerol glycerophosphotransferase n=1 Tax=Streptosporangium becharense TaxID=1816182 RepID=A0A7W9IF20_9ACTN|nr:CDP-glycerol glycerophosphotransferase family protein [Streptosporangium becharense]MBB2909541.1 CDP-glycerol glycerophosphotransferase [Streptosporangium becharense]MBB5819502.1 CDP-glycerol glycerophosphotransferase [Streptosporangium becharense]
MINVLECSVVIITYNDAARLPRAVRSVLGQSLRNLEVIVSDDASTDGTEHVVRELQRLDPRVRYLRGEVNSGGCGAPRNRGVAAARAPYVMFLDSDDELTRHACKSMLLEIERTGADFVTGQISRLYERTGKTARYYPALFARRRTVEGIEREPEMFLDSFSTNKLYRTELVRRLPFREDLHYEDHVFSTELYCAARRFAVVPWVVYLWHRNPAGNPERPSISLSITEMANVRSRIAAARLSDGILRRNGLGHLVRDRQRRFVRQDLRVYLNPLPARDPAWIGEFVALTRSYLTEFDPEVFEPVDPLLRVCCSYILDGRPDELLVAARSLNGPKAPPRVATRRDGRTYWGDAPDPRRDITELRLAELPYTASRLRHETVVTATGPGTGGRGGGRPGKGGRGDGRSGSGGDNGGRCAGGEAEVTLTIRTYDPFGVLAAAPGWKAFLRLGGHRVPLASRPQADGSHLSAVTIDLAAVDHGRLGFDGHHDPVVSIVRADGRVTSDRLLVAPAEPFTVAVPGHRVTVTAEGAAAVLRIRWRREGPLRRVPRLLRLRTRLLRRLGGPEVKLRVYKGLIRVLPPRRDLALFESDVGTGYTGSPRYVYEELSRRGTPIEVVWSVAANRRNFPAGVRLVRRMSWRYVWTMARAGYWVDSHGLPLAYPKPRRTRYLQTWHGQGVKTIGFDAPDLRADFDGPRRQWRDAVARWDALVAPSAEFERLFVPANGYRGPVLRHGSPRCDVLVHGDDTAVARVRERLELPAGRRVLLYAPTYRDRAKRSGQSVRADLTAMAEALAGDWVVILRTHPVDRYRIPERLRHFVRQAGDYPEVNDLILASDALLTDYSSLMCDYAVTGRPMLFLTDDWDEYRRTERGVYHDLPAIAPGPCLTTTGELIAALRHLDEVSASFTAKYAAFRELWCADERGHAAAKVVDAFFGPAPARAASRTPHPAGPPARSPAGKDLAPVPSGHPAVPSAAVQPAASASPGRNAGRRTIPLPLTGWLR